MSPGRGPKATRLSTWAACCSADMGAWAAALAIAAPSRRAGNRVGNRVGKIRRGSDSDMRTSRKSMNSLLNVDRNDDVDSAIPHHAIYTLLRPPAYHRVSIDCKKM